MLTIALLPGGPGLSVDTLADLKRLSEFCNVREIGLPQDTEDWSYEGLLKFVEKQIRDISDLVLCGHSFGGIQAADIAVRKEVNLRALICLGAPFSRESFQAIEHEFNARMTPKLEETGQRFTESPSNSTFQEWLESYGDIYFPPESVLRGSEMLAKDRVEYRAYLGAAAEAAEKESLLSELKALSIPKLFLAGEVDRLFPVANARRDAERGGFRFKAIAEAAHFMAFDRPTEVLTEIRMFLESLSEQK